MKNLQYYTIIFVLISFAINVNGQDCECTDCPIPILDNTITTSCLEVSGLTNPTLGAGGQGVCGISLEFNHTWLTEVQVQLIAPNGSAIDLIQDDPGGSTPNSSWDINYVPCSGIAIPDPGYPDEFTSTGYNNGVFTGTYYPGDGCFEDLSGPANGTWKLEIEDFVIIDEGEITSWSITFCDGTGTNCGPPLGCIADAGTNNITGTQYLCVDGPDYIIDPNVSDQAPLPDYEYTFTISNATGWNTYTDIVSYSDDVDFTGLDVGLYWVCGLSYLATDEPLLPVPDGIITNDDIQSDIDNSIYCADIAGFGSGCFLVSLGEQIEPLEFDGPDTLCIGEMGTITLLNNYTAYDVSVTNILSGTFSLLNVFIPIIEFIPSTDEDIEFCITIDNACGTITDCVTVVVIGGVPLSPDIIGETETCYGNTYEYTISSLDGIVDYNWYIDPFEDAYIVGSNTGSTVTVTLLDDPVQFSASICFEYEDECGIIDEVCIDITPDDLFIDNDLTPDSFCGLEGGFNIQFTGNGNGNWVQDSGPGTSIFLDQNDLNTTVTVSESGMYSFTFTTACNNLFTVDIEFFPDPQDPMIAGIFEGCPGESLMFSATNTETSTIVNWSITGDGIIMGSTNSDMVEVVLDDPGITNIATLCLEIENSCGDIIEVCEDIGLISVTFENQSFDNYCNLSFYLGVFVEGTDVGGQWTLLSGPGTVTFVDPMNSVTIAEVSQIGDYVFEFSADPCGISIEIPVTIFSEVIVDNIVVECIGEDFIVSFDVSGGEAPYLVDGIPLAGTSYTSNLQSGESYEFIVSDNTDCDNVEVAGDSECECITDAGSISPQELIVSCNELDVTVFVNGDAEFDENDGFVFILYTDLLDPLGSIILENTTGIFSFSPPLIYGIAYYVGYVVGDDIGGSIDYTDPCLDIATGASIIFDEPFNLDGIENIEILSCDIVYELTSIQTSDEVGEWSVVSSPIDASVIFDGVSGISTTATFSEPGTYTIRYLINNGLCIDFQELTFEVFEPPGLSIVNISFECDENNENYQVSFEIAGGVSPFIVNGDLFSDAVFTSSFITSGMIEVFSITDANGCEAITFMSEYECIDDCISLADMNIENPIEICGDEIVEVSESGLSILDGDDIGVFILHTNSGNVLGTILDQNTTGIFSFIPALSYDIVYYISYVVGNEIVDEVDLTDECLSVAPGQSVIFYEEPNATLVSSMDICSFDFTLEAAIISGDSIRWDLLDSPPGSSIQYTNNSPNNPSILVDRVGQYQFTLTLINGSCVSMDTVLVEVFGEHSVLVMDDFTTCNTSFEIYSLTEGNSSSWDVIGTSNYIIDNNILDSTTITFDTTGIFEIVRNVGSGICALSDTFSVEIFEESTFEILDILCDENNTTYTITYSIDGDSYPYNINGQIINDGENADLEANSGESLLISVVDANLCEVYSETIFHSCDCESEPGVMNQTLIEVCHDELVMVLPSVGSIVADSDSLIYVLHSSSGLNITNVLGVSSEGEFEFDASSMFLNTVYYVSAVVYEDGVFDSTILDDICTITSIGTPVIWLAENRIELPGNLEFCENEDVEITVIYFGELPLTIRLADDFGNDYDRTLTAEGSNTFIVDLPESSGLIVDWYFGALCLLDIIGELNVDIRPLPLVEFTADNVICNSSANGSTILLDDLITATNTSGSWIDPLGNSVSGIIDFDGFTEGVYEYQFVTSGNEPCAEETYTIPITVEECLCPMDIFFAFDGLCQGDYSLDLNDYIKPPFQGLGSWSVLTIDGAGTLNLTDSQLVIEESNVGTYEVRYSFNTLPQGCDDEYSFEIVIRENLSAGISTIDQIEICVGDLLEILLFDYLEDYDEGGIWTSQDSLSIDVLSGIVDLSLADGGLYTFEYEIPENEFCPSSSTEISILIHDPLELFLNILDPICFGANDGSVSAENINGDPIQFDLSNSAQEVISNPDSLFAGEYELRAIDENGCTIIENFTLLDPLELFLDLGEDRIVEEGEVTTITPVLNIEGEEISLYQWFVNQANLNNPTIDTLLISPDGETLIQLIITDDDGCIVDDELLLTVIDNEIPVVMASIFNPLTSTFGIEDFKAIDIINKFEIFDRWGSLVFQEKNYSPSDQSKRWDGTFNGSLLTNGVYVYSIKYTNNQGNIISVFGDVTIVR